MIQMTLTEWTERPKGQCERLLRYLEQGNSITPLESWRELGIYRLSARVFDLKRMGYDIQQELVEVKSVYGDTARVACYRMGK